MTSAELLSFALVALLLTITPGPNGVLIAKTVPTRGRSAGFANITGFVGAFYVHGILSFLGISLILVQSAQVFFGVKMLGAAYLCWIGVKALIAAWKGENPPATKQSAPRKGLVSAFAQGFLTTALNPKVAMFYLAAFPQFIAHDTLGNAVAASTFILVTIHVAIVAIWFGAITMLFHRLTVTVQGNSFRRLLNGITGLVFVGFGLRLATFRVTP